jgi:predicted RNase H-like HicB family nuclease
MMEMKLPSRIRKKGKWFISSCPVLDVFSQGRTRAEAEKNLSDALVSFLVSCHERGTLDQVLRESGFVAISAPAAKPSRARRKSTQVVVPVPFEIRATRPCVIAA